MTVTTEKKTKAATDVKASATEKDTDVTAPEVTATPVEADVTSEPDEPVDEPTDEGDEPDEPVDEEAPKESAEETEPSESDPESVEPDRPSRARWLVAGVAAVFVVAVLAGAGFLGWKVWQQHQLSVAGAQAQKAAVDYAAVLTSIDSNKVDENFDQVLNGATGEFKDMYSQSSSQLRQLLIDNKASAHGVVVESAVQSVAPNKVVVLLFVDQSVSNTNVPDPRIDRSRIKMTMELVDGQWRASKVELP